MTSTTPNTPANGGQILTDERIVEIADRVDSRVFHADWYREFARAIEADLRAALTAPASPTVDRNAPEGWKLVPLQPTDAMCIAARERLSIGANYAEHVYKAMLAAAPAVAQPDAQVAVSEKAASAVIQLMDLRGFFKDVPHKQVRIFGMELRSALENCGATIVPSVAVSVDQMVNRFLGWPLPKTFGPDCGITFDGRKDDEWNKNKPWPIGTNLLTAVEAKAMFEYVIATPASTDKPAEKK